MKKRLYLLCMALSFAIAPTIAYATPSIETLEHSRRLKAKEAENLKKKIVKITQELTELDTELSQVGEKKIKTEKDLKGAVEKEKHQREEMEKCIVSTYENGGKMHFFENILTSKTINQIINRTYYASEIQKYNNEKLFTYMDTVKEIEKLKADLQEEERTLAKKQEDAQKKEKELKKLYKDKSEEVAKIRIELQNAIIASAAQNAPDFEDVFSTTGDATAAEKIVAAAYSQIGVPYVWGGTSPGSGLDCSGLVQFCYRKAGIGLPRVSQSQGCCGTRVATPEPGDMVCYGHHIGIYIGNRKMIHAPQPGEFVKIVSVYGNPWYMRAW